MLHEPGEYERLRAEIDPLMARVSDDIMSKLTKEEADELEYVKLSFTETMRRDTPAPQSHISCMTKDIKIGDVTLRKDDAFVIALHYVQQDPKQWREPTAFKPERFDPRSDWYKKPDGGKRNPHSYVPFLGGVRICLGKTFAEMVIKISIPLWFHFFDFEFADEDKERKRSLVQGDDIRAMQSNLLQR